MMDAGLLGPGIFRKLDTLAAQVGSAKSSPPPPPVDALGLEGPTSNSDPIGTWSEAAPFSDLPENASGYGAPEHILKNVFPTVPAASLTVSVPVPADVINGAQSAPPAQPPSTPAQIVPSEAVWKRAKAPPRPVL